MIIRSIFYTLMVIILASLQATVFRGANFLGAVPLVMLIFVVSVGMLQGARVGALVGFATGLVYDCLMGKAVGISALLFMYIGLVIGVSCKDFFQHRRSVVLILVIAAEVVYDAFYYFFMFFIWGEIDVWHIFMRVILPEMAYTAVLAVPLYVLMEKIDGWIGRKTV